MKRALLILAACGGSDAAPDAGPVVPDATPRIVCRGVDDQDPVSIDAVTAVPMSAAIGERLDAPLEVRVTRGDGAAIAGCSVAWGVGAQNGWLFPLGDVTDADGRAQAWWIPGTDPTQVATAMIWVPDGWATRDLTSIVGATATRATTIAATFAGAADSLNVDLRPHVGADARIVFSWAGTEASLVDIGGVRSVRLTGPNAAPIEMPFAWQDDHTHSIELSSTVSNDVVLVIDGTQIGAQHLDSWTPEPVTISIVDDSSAVPSCLDAAERSVTISNAVLLPAPTTAVDLAITPDALPCGNTTATADNGALILTTGGTDVGDPAITHLAL